MEKIQREIEKYRHVCELFPVVTRRKESCLLLSHTETALCFVFVATAAINSARCPHFIRTLFSCLWERKSEGVIWNYTPRFGTTWGGIALSYDSLEGGKRRREVIQWRWEEMEQTNETGWGEIEGGWGTEINQMGSKVMCYEEKGYDDTTRGQHLQHNCVISLIIYTIV